jgi:hypothetical protein
MYILTQIDLVFLLDNLKIKKNMIFTGNENHEISLNEAAELTQRFRDNLPVIDNTIAEYFGKSALEDVLSQQDCVGIRVYYGIDSEMKKHLVIVGVNSDGNDLYEGALMEMTIPCPPVCSTSNPLNS